jgi:hypothetical protein
MKGLKVGSRGALEATSSKQDIPNMETSARRRSAEQVVEQQEKQQQQQQPKRRRRSSQVQQGDAAAPTEPTAQEMLREVVGHVVQVPATVFKVDIPGVFYIGTAVRADPSHKDAVEMRFHDDNSLYWQVGHACTKCLSITLVQCMSRAMLCMLYHHLYRSISGLQYPETLGQIHPDPRQEHGSMPTAWEGMLTPAGFP